MVCHIYPDRRVISNTWSIMLIQGGIWLLYAPRYRLIVDLPYVPHWVCTFQVGIDLFVEFHRFGHLLGPVFGSWWNGWNNFFHVFFLVIWTKKEEELGYFGAEFDNDWPGRCKKEQVKNNNSSNQGQSSIYGLSHYLNTGWLWFKTNNAWLNVLKGWKNKVLLTKPYDHMEQ